MTLTAYGAFIPTQEVAQAYQVYVDAFKEKKGIKEITPESVLKIRTNSSTPSLAFFESDEEISAAVSKRFL